MVGVEGDDLTQKLVFAIWGLCWYNWCFCWHVFFSKLLHQLYRYAALLILKRSHARPSARIKIQSFWCLERSPRTLKIQFQFLCDLHTRCFCTKMSFLSSQRHFRAIDQAVSSGGCFLLGLPWSHRSLGSLRHCAGASKPQVLQISERLKSQIVKHFPSIAFTWTDDL